MVNQSRTFVLQGENAKFQGQGTDLTKSKPKLSSATAATFPVLKQSPTHPRASAYPTPVLVARTAKTKYHPLGGLSNRNLSHGSGGYKSNIKVLAVLIS